MFIWKVFSWTESCIQSVIPPETLRGKCCLSALSWDISAYSAPNLKALAFLCCHLTLKTRSSLSHAQALCISETVQQAGLYHTDDFFFTWFPPLTLSALCFFKVASHFTFVSQEPWFGSEAAQNLECVRHLQFLLITVQTGITVLRTSEGPGLLGGTTTLYVAAFSGFGIGSVGSGAVTILKSLEFWWLR